jgi:hypothetical protein
MSRGAAVAQSRGRCGVETRAQVYDCAKSLAGRNADAMRSS